MRPKCANYLYLDAMFEGEVDVALHYTQGNTSHLKGTIHNGKPLIKCHLCKIGDINAILLQFFIGLCVLLIITCKIQTGRHLKLWPDDAKCKSFLCVCSSV